MKLQRLAGTVYLVFGLTACDAPQFQEPNAASEIVNSAPEKPGPLIELGQTVSAIEKQDPNPAALERLSAALKEFWHRCEMTVGCRNGDGEAMVAHSRQSVGARAVYAGYWQVWPTLFSKADSKPLRSIFTREELQHLFEEGLRRSGTNGNKAMMVALAAELREGGVVTYSNTAEVRLLAMAWAGGEDIAARQLAIHFEEHGDLRSAYLWSLRFKGSGESEYSAWQAQVKRQELAAGLSSGERARVERLADNRSIVNVSAGE